MPIREKFEVDLKELQRKLKELGTFTHDSLIRSLKALETKDINLALEVMEEDTKANILEEEINDFAIWLIAKQQPVSIDLRRIIGVIKIATDVERIADFSVNIAKSTIRIGKKENWTRRKHKENASVNIRNVGTLLGRLYRRRCRKSEKSSQYG